MNWNRAMYQCNRHLKRHAPVILTGMAAVGVVAAGVLSGKASIKASRLLEAEKAEKEADLTVLETFRIVLPTYASTVAVGMATLGCLVGVGVLNHRNQTSIAAAYGILDANFKSYRKAAKEVFGEDADKKIIAEVAKSTYLHGGGVFSSGIIYEAELDTDSEETLFYEEYTGRYFQSTVPAVMNAQYHLNRNLALKGEVSINEFFTFLGLENTPNGDDIGWNQCQMCEQSFNWIDFDNRQTRLEGGLECYIIAYGYDPGPFPDEEW